MEHHPTFLAVQTNITNSAEEKWALLDKDIEMEDSETENENGNGRTPFWLAANHDHEYPQNPNRGHEYP